jgi:hypothetical protein
MRQPIWYQNIKGSIMLHPQAVSVVGLGQGVGYHQPGKVRVIEIIDLP